MKRALTTVLLGGFALLALPAQAEDIAYWNNVETASGNAANTGKLLTVVGAQAPFWSGVGYPNGQQANSNSGWDATSDHWLVDVNTTGYSNLTMSVLNIAYYDSSIPLRSPKDWKVQVDCGSGWVDAGITYSVTTKLYDYAYTGGVTNVALPAACNNRASAKIRWMPSTLNSVVTGTISSSSNSGIDEIYIRGTLGGQAPTDITLSNNTIQTNAGANSVVGTLSTTDPNAGDTFTYSLVSGTGSTNNGLFNISGNQLRINASLAEGTYSVRINTFDGTYNYSEAFTIYAIVYPAVFGDNTHDYISLVTFNTINNATAKEPGGYGSYVAQTTSVGRSQVFTLGVTSNSTQALAPYYSRCWFDWNQDKDFDDAGEMFLVQNGGSIGSFTTSVTIPAGATLGTTRMRCIVKQGALPNPTGNIGDGEAEDYSINVTTGIVCGNGVKETGEACDDGDKDNGDGCSSTCTVESGYTCNAASPTVCTDINECLSGGGNNCSPNAACTNTVGSFTCACNAGYYGNGVTCTACPSGTANPLAGQTASTACVACSAGYFAANAGQTSCSACAAGTYSASSGASSCTACAPGSYNGNTAQSACTKCAAGTYNPNSGATSSTACLACPAGFYGDTTGLSSCVACAAGTFNALSGQTVCATCPAGTFNASTGQIACTQCAAGTANPNSGSTAASACVACSNGYYAATSGLASCTACAAGSYSATTGSTSCTLCGPGSYNDSAAQTSCKLCVAGTYNPQSGSNAASACLPCAAGFAGPSAGLASCVMCAAGTYSASTGQTSCALCAPGTYNPNVAQTACLPCASGTYNPDTGSSQVSSCKACAAGSYNAGQGQAECMLCPLGTFNPNTGSSASNACQPCAAGTFGPYAGAAAASACLECPAGTYNPNAGATSTAACYLCPMGYFAAESGAAFCDACAPGSYGNVEGAKECKLCAVGSYSPFSGMVGCDLCAPGTFADEDGLMMCYECAKGSFASGEGSAGCDLCVAGFFGPEMGLEKCLACKPGSYSAVKGAVECELCAAGSYNPYEGSVACAPCEPGSFGAEQAMTECDACAAGTYNDLQGQTVCKPCVAGTYAPETGFALCLTCDTGFTSLPQATKCSAICGDGLVVAGEACDDGNTDPADGCEGCTASGFGWFCPPDGGTCSKVCEIEGQKYADGMLNPGNECQHCNTAQSQQVWTPLGQGTECLSDDLDCTKDLCDGSGTCEHLVSTGCRIDDTCVAEFENDPANECRHCDPALSTEAYSDKAKGVGCTDEGLPWTLDICEAGQCTHPKTGNCVIEGVEVAGGSAHPDNICLWCDADVAPDAWSNRSEGFPCDDDLLACTSDVCDGLGACTHALYTGCLIEGVCVAAGDDAVGNDCLECQPLLSTDMFVAKAGGEFCTDDGLPTTQDVCDGDGLCTHPSAGVCVIAGVTYAGGAVNPDNTCLVCDPDFNPTTWANRAAGTTCATDGLECTADLCDGDGLCTHTLFVGCLIEGACVAKGALDPNNECLACAPEKSVDGYSARQNGTVCADDGLSCTSDVCQAGGCAHPVTSGCLLDGNCWAAGAVDPNNACQGCLPQFASDVWEPLGKGMPCVDDLDAGTLDVCNGNGECEHLATGDCVIDGVNVAGGAANPANECQGCYPSVDTGLWTNRDAGYPCTSDGLPATLDICDGNGVCVHENTNVCTVDGIIYQPGQQHPENECMECNPALDKAGFSPRMPDVACTDDGNLCTLDFCDGWGACGHTDLAVAACDDGNPCTNDACDPAVGCVNVANTDGCDDGDACTDGDVCADGVCTAGQLLECDDGNVCTDDSCDPAVGCLKVNNSEECDDGNLCTSGDVCSEGVCKSGQSLTCDDLNPCTLDSCAPATGCAYEAKSDSDGDLICDDLDNCPDTENPNQEDSDENGVGDACEPVEEPNPEQDADVVEVKEDLQETDASDTKPQPDVPVEPDLTKPDTAVEEDLETDASTGDTYEADEGGTVFTGGGSSGGCSSAANDSSPSILALLLLFGALALGLRRR